MTGQRFCAVDSIAASDPLPGTGAHPECNLLLSWPRKAWSRSLRIAGDMEPGLAERLDILAEQGRRVNLIHRRHWPEHQHRVYLFPENVWLDVERPALPALLDALMHRHSLSAWAPTALARNLVLCCTHGKKDKCCAKFGYRTYLALAREARKHPDRFDVWESSHLGGCRLAASMLVLPALRKYGRLSDQDVAPLMAQEAVGRPYLPCYRGSGRLTPAQQCAEIAVLEWLAQDGMAIDLEVEPALSHCHGSATIPVRWTDAQGHQGKVEVACETREITRVDTCADLAEGPSVSQCWFATRLSPR